jgi:hypothetical protein
MGRSSESFLVVSALLFLGPGEALGQTRRQHRHRHRGEAAAVAPNTSRTHHHTTASATPAPTVPAPTVQAPAPTPVVATPRPAPAGPAPVLFALPGYAPPNPYIAGRDSGRHFGSVSEDEILATLANAPVRGNLRNYGNTSVNLRVDFPGPVDGSYKPSEIAHNEHWRGEIAAFRLAQLLGIERVPPAVFRRIPEGELPTGQRYGVTFENGQSWGAMIYWVPVLRPSGVGSPESLEHWSGRLSAGVPIPQDERVRAQEISDLIVFDFLIANWDRWNGLNTLEDGDGHLVFRDNNAGFQIPRQSSRYLRVLHWLHQSQRFSRETIAHVRSLTLDTLREAMTEDADGEHPLIDDTQLRAVLERRDTLVRYVDELIRRYGEAQTLFF